VLGEHDTNGKRKVGADCGEQTDRVEVGARVDRDQTDADRGDTSDCEVAQSGSAASEWP
jgi:hypothetical protein